MSPIVWDLGHIATFEDLWLVAERRSAARRCAATWRRIRPVHARRAASAARCPICAARTPCATWKPCASERSACWRARTWATPGALLADGFVYELVLRHEQQHTETILQTLQIMTSEPYGRPRGGVSPGRTGSRARWCSCRPGPFEMGAPARGFAYDNERPRHECAVARSGSIGSR